MYNPSAYLVDDPLLFMEYEIFAPLLGIIGSIQANEALKVILDIGATVQGKLLLVDALNMEFNEAVLKKDPKCPVCN